MDRQKIRKLIILLFFLILPITLYYYSPALAVEGAYKGIITGSLLLFLILFILSFVLGRAFCGWACPGSGLQECCLMILDKKARGGRYNLIKYFIWVPWISLIIAGFITTKRFPEVNLLYQTNSGISVVDSQGYIIYFFVIMLIAIPALTVGRRGFCHYICWMVPFMIIGRSVRNIVKLPSLSLRADKGKCISCYACNNKCQMSLDVNNMVNNGTMENLECILCGECIDVCPKEAIWYCFGA